MPAETSEIVPASHAITQHAANLHPQHAVFQRDRTSFRTHTQLRFPVSSVARSILTTICGGVLLLTAAAVLNPASLQARSTLPAPPPSQHIQHQQDSRALASIINNAEQVLAFRPRHNDRGCEIILWFEDVHTPGVINLDELAVIRYSPLFQTVTLYTASKVNSRNIESPNASRPGISSFDLSTFDALDIETIAAPGFSDRWRALSTVQAKVIATGLSDMRLETPKRQNAETPKVAADRFGVSAFPDFGVPDLSNPEGGLRGGLVLHLTWASDSVDGAETSTAVVVASAMR